LVNGYVWTYILILLFLLLFGERIREWIVVDFIFKD